MTDVSEKKRRGSLALDRWPGAVASLCSKPDRYFLMRGAFDTRRFPSEITFCWIYLFKHVRVMDGETAAPINQVAGKQLRWMGMSFRKWGWLEILVLEMHLIDAVRLGLPQALIISWLGSLFGISGFFTKATAQSYCTCHCCKVE